MIGFMPVFRPPTDDFVRFGDRTMGGVQRYFWRFFEPEARGRNVYKLVDGSFSEADQRDEGQIVKIYLGGHDNYVTDVEADELVAAGYTILPGTFELNSSYSGEVGGGATLGV
jgi:hypothetical protein